MNRLVSLPSRSPDLDVLAALLAGDESTFLGLVERLHSCLMALAMVWIDLRPVAEEVVQEAWLVVLDRLADYQERGSLRAWISRIVTERTLSRARHEPGLGAPVGFAELAARELGDPAAAVDPLRFHSASRPDGRRLAGHWRTPPRDWPAPFTRRDSFDPETLALLRSELDRLPPAQRILITLRDVEAWSAEEVWIALGLSADQQVALLHRGRSRLHQALERHLAAAASWASGVVANATASPRVGAIPGC